MKWAIIQAIDFFKYQLDINLYTSKINNIFDLNTKNKSIYNCSLKLGKPKKKFFLNGRAIKSGVGKDRASKEFFFIILFYFVAI